MGHICLNRTITARCVELRLRGCGVQMREIVFRGKRIDNGEWIEGFYVALIDGAHYICDGLLRIAVGSVPRKYEVIPETVGQYTGMKDKRGKMIFEGDIIAGEDERCTTVYHCNTGQTTINRWTEKNIKYKVEFTPSSLQLISVYASKFEVIGNIHDNPELL